MLLSTNKNIKLDVSKCYLIKMKCNIAMNHQSPSHPAYDRAIQLVTAHINIFFVNTHKTTPAVICSL